MSAKDPLRGRERLRLRGHGFRRDVDERVEFLRGWRIRSFLQRRLVGGVELLRLLLTESETVRNPLRGFFGIRVRGHILKSDNSSHLDARRGRGVEVVYANENEEARGDTQP